MCSVVTEVSCACVAIAVVSVACGQPTHPECTGIMALRSASGSVHGPWEGPRMLYVPAFHHTLHQRELCVLRWHGAWPHLIDHARVVHGWPLVW
jgi:hypothetical protein